MYSKKNRDSNQFPLFVGLLFSAPASGKGKLVTVPVFRVFACALLPALAAATTVRFDPTAPDVGPFPTDALTAEDTAQRTGRRVNLPASLCQERPETCPALALLNEFDGFSPNARLRVRFSAAVDPETLKAGLRIVDGDTAIPVNQVVWDPTTFTAFAKPDRVLEPGRRYLLVATDAIRDAAGAPVTPSAAFTACLAETTGYCGQLAEALPPADRALAPATVAGASLFTTLSATAWLEEARTALEAVSPATTRLSGKSVFAFSELSGVTFHAQVGVNPDRFTDTELPFSLLAGVNRIAFGSIRSPAYLDERQVIAPASTGTNEIQYHVLLPAADRPQTGYPVVIAGHGLGDSSIGGPSALSLGFAGRGFATISINAHGHGYGPRTRFVLSDWSGNTTEVDGGGRAVDLNGDGAFDSPEGCLILNSATPILLRDCLRQTVVDLMQLVRALRAGIDLDGDGALDLDPNRIYYAGISLGAIYGTMLNAVEPDIRAAVLNVGGGSVVDIARWGQSYHHHAVDYLKGISSLNAGGDFAGAWPLRDQPVRTVEDPAAIRIQELFEWLEWLDAPGDPLFFAQRLKKPVLWLIAKGDRSVPNPTNSALIRAAGGRESTWLYRHDLARKVYPSLDENPHSYLANLFSIPGLTVALAAQQQAAAFLDTGSAPNPNTFLLRLFFGGSIFEIPDVLPEELNY